MKATAAGDDACDGRESCPSACGGCDAGAEAAAAAAMEACPSSLAQAEPAGRRTRAVEADGDRAFISSSLCHTLT